MVGLGVVVAVSTALQNAHGENSPTAWRPYVLVSAALTGLVAAWQLAAGWVMDRAQPAATGEPLSSSDPRRIGSYRVVSRLGAGAMGRAYLAVDRVGRYVALKVIRSEYAEDAEFRRRFAREVSAAGKVHGRYTTGLIDADPDADQPWLVTTYVGGPSLRHAIEAYGAWSPDQVWWLATGLAEALGGIHAAGVVHRDLKPANVLLSADGPRVIDFGIARAADASHLTATAVRPGTPAFMAPEQATGGQVGPAADVFALGVVLAYAATGRAPFGDGDSQGILYRVVHQPPDLTGIDGDLRALIEACLDKRPDRRPTPAQIMARAADRIEPIPVGQWLPEPVTKEVHRRERATATPRRGRTSLLTATSLLALLIALASVGLQFRSRPSAAAATGQPSGPPTVSTIGTNPTPAPTASPTAVPSPTVSPRPSPTRGTSPPRPGGVTHSTAPPTRAPTTSTPSRPKFTATASGSPTNHDCGQHVIITAIISTTSGPVTASYDWSFGLPDGGGDVLGSYSFTGSGSQQHTVTIDLTKEDITNHSGDYTATLRITSPSETSSNHVTVTLNC